MAELKVHAGDWVHNSSGSYHSMGGVIGLKKEGQFFQEVLSVKDIEVLEIASEESVKQVGGTVGWSVAGAVVLGPVGLLAGLLMGGRGKNTTFVAQFQDGRKVLATTTAKAFNDMQRKFMANKGI